VDIALIASINTTIGQVMILKIKKDIIEEIYGVMVPTNGTLKTQKK